MWEHLNLTLESGQTYCLMGASGSGKTTLFRILLGLEQAGEGSIRFVPRFKNSAGSNPPGSEPPRNGRLPLVAVFQEDRLCERFSPLDNVMLAADRALKNDTVYQELCRLLPEEAVTRPVSTLSGGMKRRVAIVRAMLAPSAGILMDEPFTGLDEDTKSLVISYIKEKAAEKLLLIATHQKEDIAALQAKLLRLF